MTSLFGAFLALVATHALLGPWIGGAERALALAALLILLSRVPQRLACVAGILLGVAGALQLHGHRLRSEAWAEQELLARVECLGEAGGNLQLVQASAPGLPALRLRVYGDRLLPELRSHRRGVALLAIQPLPSARNPDDRNPARSSLARGALLRARLMEFHATGERRDPSRRASMLLALERRLQGSSALWRALLLGDRSELHPQVRERVRKLGLAHLLALSGMHVGGLLALIAFSQRGRRIPMWALLPLGLWILLAGASASLLRAGLMAAWWMLARRWRRRVRGEDAIAFAGFVDLCVHPERSADVGWCLSYAATFALIRALGALPRSRLGRALALSSAAALATAPWALSVFGQLVWISPLSNLLVALPFAVLMAAGVLLTLLGSAVAPLQSSCDFCTQLLSHAFGYFLWGLDRIAPEALGHPGLHGAWWGLALVLWLIAFLPRPAGPRRALALVLILLAVHLPLLLRARMNWWSLDVGQGDAGVLRSGRSWLIVDSGPQYSGVSAAERVLLPFLRRRNARGVGYAITHGHLDHMGGAELLLESGRVATLHLAASDSSLPWVRPLVEQCERGGIELSWLARGDILRQGELALTVLWPPAVDAPEHANDRSLVLMAGPPRQQLLLSGDLERIAERALLAEGVARIRFLKVAHHGGDTGSDLPWLEQLDPEWAIISCGRGNRYGHPAPELLERLQLRGIPYARTDLQGWLGIRWNRDGSTSTAGGP